jgi:4-hydroxythreonine-4-phosphate dehydrogenase
MNKKRKTLIITLGDPLGIGPEITFKALKKFPQDKADFILISDKQTLKNFKTLPNIKTCEVKSDFKKTAQHKATKWGADISFKSVLKAIELLKNKEAQGLITAPVSKEGWAKIDVKWTGHTELLKHYAKKDGALMMFKTSKLMCALASEHFAIKDLPKILTKKRIKNALELLFKITGKKTPVGLSALNPHASDGGKFGSEEKKILTPLVEEFKKKGFNLFGPIPTDALWQKHMQGFFKAILCLQHDIAILGIKLASKEPVVHITAGLKFIRTSPAHGTAFDIAGKNKADSSSMLEAIKTAYKLAK